MTTSTRGTGHTRPRLVDEPGIRFGMGQGALVMTALTVAVLHLPTASALMALAVAAFVSASFTPAGWAVLLGLSAWAFYTGFLENRLGQLTLAGGDLGRLVALVLVAVSAVLLNMTGEGRE